MHSSDGDRTIDGAEPRPDAEARGASLSPSRDYAELYQVDRHHYLINGEIAKGGMGRVLDARDLRLGRNVAIKELLPKNRDAAKRFEREARVTARLQHPAIIHVYEAGVWPGGEPFYAMQKVSGRSLDKVVAERATVAERLALLPNVIAVADALAYAHSQNVIHRDLKPANVLVGEFGETVVIDWGLAKDLGTATDPRESLAMQLRALPDETVSGSVVGTPAYMPPEQARGESIDQRVDVYAIGALLYKVLSGEAPYTGKHGKEVLEQVKAGPPQRIATLAPGAPRDLVAIVEKAMARNPDDRYVTAGELAQDLKRFETGQLVAAHRYTRAQLLRRFVRRHRVALMVAVVSLATLAVVARISIKQIVAKRRAAEAGQIAVVRERGRRDLLDDRPGVALQNLLEALRAGRDEALEFLVADAIRPFDAQLASMQAGETTVRIAVSRDGRIATAGSRGVKVWNADGALERDFGQAGHVHVLAFDPMNKYLATAGDDGVLRLWTRDGSPLATVTRAHEAAIEDLAFSPDGARIATAGADHVVKLWNTATAQSLGTGTCDDHDVLSIRFSPNGKQLATGGLAGGVCVFDSDDAMRRLKLPGHGGRVSSVRWSADSLLLVTASDDGMVHVWSAARGKPVVAPISSEGKPPVYDAEISSDNRVVTTSADHLARIWELPDIDPAELTDENNDKDKEEASLPPAKPLSTLRGHAAKVITAAWSDDEKRVATADFDGRAIVWEAADGQRVASFEHADVVGSLAFLDENRRLVTGSRDGTARIWDIDRASVQRRRVEVLSPVRAVAVSGDVLAIGAEDSYVRLVRGMHGPEVLRDGHVRRVLALAFTPAGDRLISGGEDQFLVVWDVVKGIRIGELQNVTEAVLSIAVAPDGDTVAAASGGKAIVWSLATGRHRVLDGGAATINTLAFSPDGLLAGGGSGQLLVLWDPRRSDAPVETRKQSGPVTALAFSRDGRSLAVGGQGETRIYAIAEGKLGAALRLEGPTGDVRAVAFSHGDGLLKRAGGLLVTASDEGTAKVWDARTGKLLGTRDPHARGLAALALSEDGRRLWIAGDAAPPRYGDDTQGVLGEWDLHVERRSYEELKRFVDTHVPWVLTEDDVVERRDLQGADDDQR